MRYLKLEIYPKVGKLKYVHKEVGVSALLLTKYSTQ